MTVSLPRGMTTLSGRSIDPLNLKTSDICIGDIAGALSRICRYGGHIPTFYSVAEHCLYVSNMVERETSDPGLALAALLHDAGEAYLGDIITPLKYTEELAAYRAVEDRAEAVIEEAFGLETGALSDPTMKKYDKEIVGWEFAMIRNAPWRAETPSTEIRKAYLIRFSQLQAAVRKRKAEAPTPMPLAALAASLVDIMKSRIEGSEPAALHNVRAEIASGAPEVNQSLDPFEFSDWHVEYSYAEDEATCVVSYIGPPARCSPAFVEGVNSELKEACRAFNGAA